jgi:hypothetical protein
MTLQGIQSVSTRLGELLVLGVTEDDSPWRKDDTRVSPQGFPVSELPTRCLGVVDGIGYVSEFAGEIAVEKLASTMIHRFAAWKPDSLMAGGSIPALDVGGFETFEQRLTWHFSNQSGAQNARFKF